MPAGFAPQYLSTDPWVLNLSEKLEYVCAKLSYCDKLTYGNRNPEYLTAEEWYRILRINKAMYGFTVREKEKDVVNARYPAFVMRKPANVDGFFPVGAGTADVAQPGVVLPEFEVLDASSISITEIKSDLQYSLAQNGFSSHTVEAAA